MAVVYIGMIRIGVLETLWKAPRILKSSSALLKLNIKTLKPRVVATACIHCGQNLYANDKKSDLVEIYYGPLSKQIRHVKAFSLMTSVAGIIAQPVLYKQIVESGGGMSLTIFVGSFLGFFTFATPFLLHTITRKYVTHIHYNSNNESYVASLYGFFLQKKEIPYKREDIEVVDVPGMFTSFHIKGQPVFVDSRQFYDVNHYAKMMGYDKPIDFKMDDISEEKK